MVKNLQGFQVDEIIKMQLEFDGLAWWNMAEPEADEDPSTFCPKREIWGNIGLKLQISRGAGRK